MFAAITVRSDIMFAINNVSRLQNNYPSTHSNTVKRIVRYLKGTSNLDIKDISTGCDILGYSDADYASDTDTRKSTSGYVFKLANGAEIYRIQKKNCLKKGKLDLLLKPYDALFKNEVWKIPNYKYSIKLRSNGVSPKFFRFQIVPYALESLDITTKVIYTEWSTRIVSMMKKNRDIWLCAHYKSTINPMIQNDNYPIPKIEDIFAKMNGGKYFCTLDVSQAYLHIEVDEDTAILQAVSTHLGKFKVRQLVFGTKVAPNCWQRYMNQLLGGVEGVSCFFDDTKVQAATFEETLRRLEVLSRLRASGLHLNKAKCKFFKNSVKYLRHVIDTNELHTSPDKINAYNQEIVDRRLSEGKHWLLVIDKRLSLHIIDDYWGAVLNPALISTLIPFSELCGHQTTSLEPIKRAVFVTYNRNTMYGLILENLVEYIKQTYGSDKWDVIRKDIGIQQDNFSTHQVYGENLIPNIATKAIESGVPYKPGSVEGHSQYLILAHMEFVDKGGRRGDAYVTMGLSTILYVRILPVGSSLPCPISN
ncbi:hypothetical protein Trydic_g7777 [Trypoxylus dichotomus]